MPLLKPDVKLCIKKRKKKNWKELLEIPSNIDIEALDSEEESNTNTDNVDELYDRIEILKINLENFSFSLCSLVADIIVTIEFIMYDILSSKKIEEIELTELTDSKNERLILLLSMHLETLFNSTLHLFQQNKSNEIVERIKKLSSYLPHSEFCILHILARKTMNTFLTLPRHNFLIDTKKLYKSSVIKCVNKSLNNEWSNIPNFLIELCQGDCDNKCITDPKYKDKNIFNFQINIE